MDPYRIYRQNQASVIESQSLESQMEQVNGNIMFSFDSTCGDIAKDHIFSIAITGDSCPKKKARGPTQMRAVWGRRESEGPLHLSCNEFGQTTDETGQSFSSFIGSMIRDGKIAPLDYVSWHKVPEDVKEKIWSLAKVGVRECVKSILNPDVTIAIGTLYSTDPAQKVNGQELGAWHYEVFIQYVSRPNERLDRPCHRFTTIGETIGMHIAWPKVFLYTEEVDARHRATSLFE